MPLKLIRGSPPCPSKSRGDKGRPPSNDAKGRVTQPFWYTCLDATYYGLLVTR